MFVPPISVIFARNKRRYIDGLTKFREDAVAVWLEVFAVAAAQASALASRYLDEVAALQQKWRDALRRYSAPRSDSATWSVIDVLPAHPVVTVSVAVTATERTKPAINNAMVELQAAGVLRAVSESKRNRAWEASGLLDLISAIETGRVRAGY